MKLRRPARNIEFELLLEDIRKTKIDMDTANCKFDYALDHELIDSYIFEVNSIYKRYNHLIERAKKLELNCNPNQIVASKNPLNF